MSVSEVMLIHVMVASDVHRQLGTGGSKRLFPISLFPAGRYEFETTVT